MNYRGVEFDSRLHLKRNPYFGRDFFLIIFVTQNLIMSKLLAPNGKPSKLTPKQYKLVRSSAFKKWFGDWEKDPANASKVIDEETKEPLVVYHGYLVGGGAGKEFYEFKNLPAFFSTTKDFAYQYASTKSMDAGIDADIYTYPCFLNIRKLFDSKNKENIKLAEEQLPEKIEISHGTAWFLSADISKEKVIEQMMGIITIPTDDLSEDILSSNVGDIIAEKVSASQYENKILLYKDEDWGYITDEIDFNNAIEYEVAQWINNDYEKTIKYKDKYLKTFILNTETYRLELNQDPLFLEYLNEVEKRKKHYFDNILNLLNNNRDRRIKVENEKGNTKYFYIEKINLKTYKTITNNNWTMFENETLQKFLIDNNFGGWSALEKGDKTYGVYNANNIKLADGTNTTFDGGNADIRFDDGGEIEKYEIGGIYQGTPHDFDKYSTEYIGTGEGLQAFGWGLYFTDIKDIAKNYAKNELLIQKEISRKSDNSAHLWIYTNISDNVVDKLGYLKIKLKEFEELKNEYKKDTWEREIETYSTLIDIIKNYQGKIYSVTLFKGEKESDYDLIQWEKPLGVDDLIKIFDEAEKIDGIDFKDGWELDEKYGLTNQKGNKVTGEEMYRWLSKKLDGDKEASLFLLRAGIDGIKYKAGTLSSFDDLDGYNYVIFDADDVTVESKEKFKKGGEVNTGLFSQIWEWFGIKF